jgi:dUTP pyrophosphatase
VQDRTYKVVGARDLDEVAEKLGLDAHQHLMLKSLVVEGQGSKSVESTLINPFVKTDEEAIDEALRVLSQVAGKKQPVLEDFAPNYIDPYASERRSLRVPGILWKKLQPEAIVPTKGTPSAAGWDLYAVESFTLCPGELLKVYTRVACAIPDGWYGQVLGRSGLASKGVMVLGGVIDSDYRGELVVMLKSVGPLELSFVAGDRIAQMVIIKVGMMEGVEVYSLDETDRGAAGFGSTGK